MTTINSKAVVEGIVLGILLYVSVTLGIIIYVSNKYNISLNYDKDLDEFMYNAYQQAKGKKGNVKLVKGFNIVKNTLPFANITINPKEGGNCLGYCYVTRELFQDTLIKSLRKHFKEVYNISFLSDAELNLYTIDVVKTKNKITNEVSKNVFEILKAVTYYQRRVDNSFFIYRSDQVMPKTFLSKRSGITYHIRCLKNKMGIIKSNMYKTIDLNELLLNKIDGNSLVIIGISGYDKKNNIGHCVLAYKYEILSNDEIKVFVYDCNIPITEDDINVPNQVFILFKLVKGEWQYIYRPFIEKDYYIDSDFNSYVPGVTIKFM